MLRPQISRRCSYPVADSLVGYGVPSIDARPQSRRHALIGDVTAPIRPSFTP